MQPDIPSDFGLCESPHSHRTGIGLKYQALPEGFAISKDPQFDDCMILSRDAFDPDAVFLDDIVDDDVLPFANLAVEGLTTPKEKKKGELELRPDDVAANDDITPDTVMPDVSFGHEQLDVYGWERSIWRKFRNYFGF